MPTPHTTKRAIRSFDDPVHRHNGKWWFWDETWADRVGPFETEGDADKAFNRYCREELDL